jgi:copper chaperone CopZ
MTCANCVRHVTEAVETVSGVNSVSVDLDAGTAQIQGDPDSAAVIAAIVAAGYQATE